MSQPDTDETVVADGRRRRGQDNRARIVAAMLDLIRGGDISPSAEQVAQQADVALRTVFRHFADMDSLYREMSEVIEAEMRAVAEQPFRADHWRDRVIELIERRGAVFERIAPFKRASEVLRHRSQFLQNDGDRLVAALRLILERELPPEVMGDRLLLETLDLLLGWEAWARLRNTQRLSAAEARQVLEAAVDRLLPEASA